MNKKYFFIGILKPQEKIGPLSRKRDTKSLYVKERGCISAVARNRVRPRRVKNICGPFRPIAPAYASTPLHRIKFSNEKFCLARLHVTISPVRCPITARIDSKNGENFY